MRTFVSRIKQAGFGLAVATAMTTLAPAASASTVQLEYQGGSAWGAPSWYRTVSYTLNGIQRRHGAGLFRLVDSDTGDLILAWCIDLLHVLSLPAEHSTTIASATDAQLENIDRLFTSSYAEVNSSNTAAGFQLALWEIMTDTGSTSGLNLGAGNFQTAGTAIRYQLAETYLDRVGTAATGGYDLTTYFNEDSQNLVSGVTPPPTPVGTPPAVPLPATALLMLTGLAGMGALRRRRKPS